MLLNIKKIEKLIAIYKQKYFISLLALRTPMLQGLLMALFSSEDGQQAEVPP